MPAEPALAGSVAFEGPRPMYRLKRRPDATAWLFTTDTDQRRRLLDAGAAYFGSFDEMGGEAIVAATERIDFSVEVCAHPWGGSGIPVDQFDEVSRVLVDTYLAQPNALRTNDGRRILNICDSRGIGDGSPGALARFTRALDGHRQALRSVRADIAASGGEGCVAAP